MLRTTLLIFTVLASSGAARANSWAEGLFDEMSRDFGAVPRGQMLVHVFRVVNNTKLPVQISNVRVSCDCTKARTLSYNLAPGQETGILVQMNSGRFLGVRAITVYVTFIQPTYEEVRLIVQANSRDDVFFAPDNLSFGKIRQGTTPSAQMTVTFSGQPQVQITEVKSDSNYIQPKVMELRRDAAGVVYQISTSVRADIPEGKWYTDIWVATNQAPLAKLRIPLTVEVDPPAPPTAPAPPVPPTAQPTAIAAKPATNINLEPVKAGTETERKIILSGAQPFRIIGVQGSDGKELIVQPVSTDSKTVHVLTLTIRASQPGQLIRNIHVQTDMQNNRDIEFNAQTQILP